MPINISFFVFFGFDGVDGVVGVVGVVGADKSPVGADILTADGKESVMVVSAKQNKSVEGRGKYLLVKSSKSSPEERYVYRRKSDGEEGFPEEHYVYIGKIGGGEECCSGERRVYGPVKEIYENESADQLLFDNPVWESTCQRGAIRYICVSNIVGLEKFAGLQAASRVSRGNAAPCACKSEDLALNRKTQKSSKRRGSLTKPDM